MQWEKEVLEWLPLLLGIILVGSDGGSWGDLGDLQSERIRFEEAEISLQRALEFHKKALGSDHPDTLMSLNNLGNLLYYKADYEGAEELYRQAIQGYEKALGSDHPDTLMSLNNLGSLLSDKGDYEGAEELCRRALEGYQKALGSDHPSTLMSLNNLAFLLNKMSKTEEAVFLLKNAYSRSQISGDAVCYNLACYECLSGNSDEAKRLIAEHLKLHPEMKEQALQDSDFDTIKDYIETL